MRARANTGHAELRNTSESPKMNRCYGQADGHPKTLKRLRTSHRQFLFIQMFERHDIFGRFLEPLHGCRVFLDDQHFRRSVGIEILARNPAATLVVKCHENIMIFDTCILFVIEHNAILCFHEKRNNEATKNY